MLNKDQYNQDEYNDYYKQEAEGAEIKGFNEDEGGFMGKVILFLGLIALGVAGYFGFKAFSTTTEDSHTLTKEKLVIKEEASKTSESTIEEEAPKTETIEKKVIKTIEINKIENNKVTVNTEETIKEEVTTQVQEKLENNQKMSTEDISKIVSLVMNKMEKEKVETLDTNNDNDLLNALENRDNDILEIKPKEDKTITSNSESAIEKKIEKVDTYNKVTLDTDSKNNDEELTELSKQIKKLLNMADESNEPRKKPTQVTTEVTEAIINNNSTTSYEKSIRQEIKVRSNEMRIIIVKQGDTLNKIAKRAYGKASSYQKIFDANPDILNRADRISVGQKLRIPK